jgi:uncharacterized integral membrane protein
MFRTIRLIFLAILGLVLVTLALANRDMVTVRVLPQEIEHFFGFSSAVSLPLYAVIYGGIVAGLLIGFVWEWIREARIRAEAERARRAVSKLENEVKSLRGTQKGSPDEVLALLE